MKRLVLPVMTNTLPMLCLDEEYYYIKKMSWGFILVLININDSITDTLPNLPVQSMKNNSNTMSNHLH